MKLIALLALLSLSATSGFAFGLWVSQDPLKDVRSNFNQGRYQEVISQLSPNKLQTLSRQNLNEAYIFLGSSYEKLARPLDALEVYQLGVKFFPKDIQILKPLGLLLHKAQLEEEAEPLFERILDLSPADPDAHLGLAEIDRSLGLWDDSISHYKKTLLLYDKQPLLWRDEAEVLMNIKNYDDAVISLKESLTLAENPETRFDLALAERGRNRYPAAIEQLDSILEKNPDFMPAQQAKIIWLFESGNFASAEKSAAVFFQTQTDDPLIHFVLAENESQRGFPLQAKKNWEAALLNSDISSFIHQAASTALASLATEKK